jgi:hypothetical protein
LTRWNSWLEAVVKHNNLFEFYEDLIENLNKSKINSPLIEVLDQLIKNPIIRHQIKFISSISKPIINAILCSQRQEIMSTEMFKYTNDLITIFREIYGFITTSNDYLE